MKKKILSILLCFCMVISLLPTAALAAGNTYTETRFGLTVTQTGADSQGFSLGAKSGGTYAHVYDAYVNITQSGTYTISGTYNDTLEGSSFTGAFVENNPYGMHGIIDVSNAPEGSNITLILDNLTIETGYWQTPPILLSRQSSSSTVNVTIQLKGSNLLANNVGANGGGAIVKQDGTGSLTFTGNGSLTAKARDVAIGAPIIYYGSDNWVSSNCTNITFAQTGSITAEVLLGTGTPVGVSGEYREGTASVTASNITMQSGMLNLINNYSGTLSQGAMLGASGRYNYFSNIQITGGKITTSTPNATIGSKFYSIGGYSRKNNQDVGVNISGGTIVSSLLPYAQDICSADYAYGVYIAGSAVSSLSVKVDGEAYPYTSNGVEPQSGKVWLWLPAGNAAVTLNGTTYYGVVDSSNNTELKQGFNPITGITGLPTVMNANSTITLAGVVSPIDATFTNISKYEILDAGTTGATLSGSTLTAPGGGTVKLRSSIAGGGVNGETYAQEFSVTVSYTAVTNITGIPNSLQNGNDVTLTPSFTPSDASYKTIAWSVKSGSATLSGSQLTPTAPGTVELTATVANGSAYGTAYTKDFTITVPYTPVTDITATIPSTLSINEGLSLSGAVTPSDASYRTITWSVEDTGTTGSAIMGNTLTATAAGMLTLRATVENGLSAGQDFTKDYTIQVLAADSLLDINVGPITITQKDDTTNTVTFAGYSGGSKDVPKSETIVVTGNNTGNKITVDDTTANILLRDVSLTSAGDDNCIDLKNGASLTLSVAGSNTLTAGSGISGSSSSAIHVPAGTAMTMEDGGGSLSIVSNRSAAIGGNCTSSGNSETAGTIIINGGTVTASSKYGAAIGGGYSENGTGGAGSSITINGGTITASSQNGAAIGGGYSVGGTGGANGIITITGGTVTASSQFGAAIGGGGSQGFGTGGAGGTISISGGIVTATNTYWGAAIGGGCCNGSGTAGAGGTVTISGGTVTANAKEGYGTMAIGGGMNNSYAIADNGTLKITGGSVITNRSITGGEAPYIIFVDDVRQDKSNTCISATSDGTTKVYYTTIDVSQIYGNNASITNASIKNSSYGFNDVKTDANGVLHLYLPANADNTKTTAAFNGATYDGTITSTESSNVLKKLVFLTASTGTLSATGAELNMTSENGASVYYVKATDGTTYGVGEGSKVESAAVTAGNQAINLTDSSCTISLSGLSESTQYTYYLVAKVGSTYSDVVSVTFTTLKKSQNLQLTGTVSGKAFDDTPISHSTVKGDLFTWDSEGALSFTYFTDSNGTKTNTANSGAVSEGAAPKNAGTYYLKATLAENGEYAGAETNYILFTITKSATEFEGGIKTYNGDAETNTFTYGDTITVKVTPKATGTAPVTNGLRTLQSFSTPTLNQMALFVGETQITEPQEVISGQELTVTYNTTGTNVITPDTPVDITAKYVGNDNMTDYEQSIGVTVSAVAEVTKGSTVSYAGTLQGAFDLIGSGETGTIKVLKDIDLGTTNVNQTNGTVTLDLNGKIISAALIDESKFGVFCIGYNANLAITDSGENGEIRNVASGLVLPVITAFGTFSINDGKLYAECLSEGLLAGTAVSVYDKTTTITGNACLEGRQYAMQTTGGTVNIQSGQLRGTNGIYCGQDANLNITGGLIQGANISIKCDGVNNIIIDGGILIGTVFDSNDSEHTGTIIFNTGALFGNAKEGIFCDPDNWTDMSSLTGWQVKGNVSLPINAEIPSGKTFTIPDGATVSIGNGVTLTNNGILLLKGMLNGTGTLSGTGEFKTTVFTADDIQSIQDQVYTGSALEPEISFNTKTIVDKEFIVDASGYAKTYENNTNVNTAKVVFTNKADENDKVEKSFNIVKSSTTFDGGIKTYNGDAETNTFTYGDTITVKVIPKATGTVPVTSSLRMLSGFSAPVANQMALFVGETQITEPVDAIDGVYTMTYDTTSKNFTIGSNTITAKYVGNSDMVDYSDTVTVTLNKKAITSAEVNASDASARKVYDGTNSFEGVALTALTDVESSDTISAIANGTVTDVNAGTGKTFAATSITLDGDDKDYYSLDKGVVSGNVSITQATATGVNQELQVIKEWAKEYTFDLSKMLPSLSDGKSFGNITYTVETVTNTDNILVQNPTNSDIADGKITLKAANVTDKDKTATVQIKVKSTNYKEFTADLTVKIIDKTPLNVEAVFTGGTYNGKPYTYTDTPIFKNGTDAVTGITYTTTYVGTDGTTYGESETAPINAGKYNLVLTVSGESANTYAGTTTIGFEIAKKQITAKPYDASIESNASFPAYTWSIDTGIAGETITATNAGSIVMEAQENGTKLGTVKVGTFDIVFTTAPIFNPNGDTEKNYDIQMGKGKLTVTKHNSDGSSSSNDKKDSNITVTTLPATADNPNPQTQATATVVSTVTDGTANVTISQSIVADAISKAQAEAKKNSIVVEIKVDTKNSNASNLSANLPKRTIYTLVKAEVKKVCINSGVVEINLDLETLKTIQNEINADVNVSAKKVDNSTLSAEAKAVVSNRPVFDLSITGTTGTRVTDFDKGKISVSIPYILGANEKAENVVAYYIDNDGKVQEMPNSVYDEESKTLMFVTDHFSKFAVGYKADIATVFSDIATHWAKDDIEFVTERGLFSGTGDGKFSPNMSMTRGMFVTVLGRLAGADVSGYKNSSFADVKVDAYYMPYIEWARKNGIVKGTSEATFAPDQSITREQMAVIMASYAKTAVKQMQMSGIIAGKNDNKFDPQGTATRGEVSAVLKRFIELAEKK